MVGDHSEAFKNIHGASGVIDQWDSRPHEKKLQVNFDCNIVLLQFQSLRFILDRNWQHDDLAA